MDMNALNDIEVRFLGALRRTYTVYAANHPRSNEKLKVLHGWIREELGSILDNGYTIMSLSDITGVSSKEKKIKGKYYCKDVDICVSRDNMDIGIISVKFINSSFIKNANNYIEIQMGETANLQNDNIVFGHLFCLTEPVPKYKSDKTWKDTDDEKIREKDIKKYYKLVNDRRRSLHKPDVQGICIAKLDRSNIAGILQPTASNVTISDLVAARDLTRLSARYRTFILTQMDIKTFFTDFVRKVEAKYNALQQANQQNQP